MIGPQMRLQLISGDYARPDNHHLSILQHLSEGILQERSNVRDRLLDMLPIGTNEPTQRHVVIPNFNGASFQSRDERQRHNTNLEAAELGFWIKMVMLALRLQ